jgi:hypothetical protein
LAKRLYEFRARFLTGQERLALGSLQAYKGSYSSNHEQSEHTYRIGEAE